MIICQNCGTTNNENVNRVCRTCGALLPVPTKHHRPMDQKTEKEKKKEKKKTEKPAKVSIETEKKKEEKLDLHEIPKESEMLENQMNLQETPPSSNNILESSSLRENGSTLEESESKGLEEITPQPFKGSIFNFQKNIISPPSLPTSSKDAISDAFLELKNSVLDKNDKKSSVELSPIPVESTENDTAVLKQKRLEKDMTEVLGFLSKKISVKKLETPKVKRSDQKDQEEKIPPASMNEILKQLLQLDLNIEASAIIKTDGAILASAISSRISDSLFATVGMNLSMIGTDIIEGLNAGFLKSISVKGTEGVLDLAPIDQNNPNVKDMLLILFSNQRVKSGIIAFAVHIVKKQLKEYLGLKI